jgi:hypothetical protein
VHCLANSISIAAIDGKLGQHETDFPDGQPILNDPKFVVYEKVGVLDKLHLRVY